MSVVSTVTDLSNAITVEIFHVSTDFMVQKSYFSFQNDVILNSKTFYNKKATMENFSYLPVSYTVGFDFLRILSLDI